MIWRYWSDMINIYLHGTIFVFCFFYNLISNGIGESDSLYSSWFCRWLLNDSIDASFAPLLWEGSFSCFCFNDCVITEVRCSGYSIFFFTSRCFNMNNIEDFCWLGKGLLHLNWSNLRMAWCLFYCDSNFIWIFPLAFLLGSSAISILLGENYILC